MAGPEIMIGASLAMTAIGTGIQMYSASQAAGSQSDIAGYNQQIAQQNAMWQQMAAQRAAETASFNAQLQTFNAQQQQMQSQFMADASRFSNEQQRMQSEFVDMQAALQRNTAAMLRQQATGEEQQAQEQANRIRKEKERILGLQRSQYAKGGVATSSLSVLDVLKDTQDTFETQALDTRLLANLSANKQRYEAGVTDFNAGITSLEASAMRDQANINDNAINFNLNQDMFKSSLNLAAAKMEFDDAQWEKAAAGAGYRIAMRQADIEYQSGMSQSRATQMGVWSSLVGGVGSMASAGSSYYGMKTAKPSTTNNFFVAKG